jgi:hypothetical protein
MKTYIFTCPVGSTKSWKVGSKHCKSIDVAADFVTITCETLDPRGVTKVRTYRVPTSNLAYEFNEPQPIAKKAPKTELAGVSVAAPKKKKPSLSMTK